MILCLRQSCCLITQFLMVTLKLWYSCYIFWSHTFMFKTRFTVGSDTLWSRQHERIIYFSGTICKWDVVVVGRESLYYKIPVQFLWKNIRNESDLGGGASDCCSEKVSIDLMGGAPQSRLSVTDIPQWAGMFWLWKHPLFSVICWEQPWESWPLNVAVEGKTVLAKSCQWSTFLEGGFFLERRCECCSPMTKYSFRYSIPIV